MKLGRNRIGRATGEGEREGRILVPFTAQGLSQRALDAALRLARAEEATIVPAFLVRVPRTLPLDSPLPAACSVGMPLQEVIEQRAGAAGVAVDARVSRGRTYRDALGRLLAQERFDRVVIAAGADARHGLAEHDLGWLLAEVPAEVVILRPAVEPSGRDGEAGSRA